MTGFFIFGIAVLVIALIGLKLLLRPPVVTQCPNDAELEKALEALRRELAEKTTEYAAVTARMRAEHEAQIDKLIRDAEVLVNEHKAELDLQFAETKRSEAKKTAARSRTALVAKIAEHLTPFLAGFPYNPKDARHWGEIFDFLVLDGLEDGEIRKIIFLEVKNKRSRGRITNPREVMLREAIEAGRVAYEIFYPDLSVPEDDIAGLDNS